MVLTISSGASANAPPFFVMSSHFWLLTPWQDLHTDFHAEVPGCGEKVPPGCGDTWNCFTKAPLQNNKNCLLQQSLPGIKDRFDKSANLCSSFLCPVAVLTTTHLRAPALHLEVPCPPCPLPPQQSFGELGKPHAASQALSRPCKAFRSLKTNTSQFNI